MFGGTMYPDAKHSDSLKIGESYQEYIARVIKEQFNFTINYYKTKIEQYTIGESKEMFEVKLDSQIDKYNRLSIEVAEKTKASNANWIPSGIMRKDNTKWYVQGDFRKFWIFSKQKLVNYFYSNKLEVIEKRGTIKTFYISVDTADKLAVRKIVIIQRRELAQKAG